MEKMNIMEAFNIEMISHMNSIEEKEVKILLALSDLLEEKKESSEDFIQASLCFLKEHYGLTKNVWSILLKLYDEVPDFLIKLSNFKEFNYGYSPRFNMSSNEELNLKEEYPENIHKQSHSLREINIKILFNVINELNKHFIREDIKNIISSFVIEFDNGENSYSMNTLKQLCRNNYDNNEVNFSSWNIKYLVNTVNNTRKIHPQLRKMNTIELERHTTKYDYRKYKKSEKERIIKNRYQLLFERMGFIYEREKEFDMLDKIKSTYYKYTSHSFISYMGLIAD